MTPAAKSSVATDRSETFAVAHIGAEGSHVDSVFVHATGFCKELWIPVVREAEAAGSLLSSGAMLLDQRGHGDSTPFSGSLKWDLVARDVVEVLADVPHPVVGIGHSGGGAAVARAEILSPGTFSTLILIEPIFYPPPFERRDLFLAVGAEKRRRTFSSRAEARQRFAHGPFSAWDKEVLDLYVDHAFRDADEGWTLKCEPSVEAECYRQGSNVDTWDRLGEIACTVVVVSGETSDSHQEPWLSTLVDRFRDATSVVVEGVGHLAPMEQPARIGGLIAEIVASDGRGETPVTIA